MNTNHSAVNESANEMTRTRPFSAFKKYLFCLGCGGSLLLRGLFSRCDEQGLFSHCDERGLFSSCDVQASHCRGFSRCGAQAPGLRYLQRVGSVVVAPGLQSTGSVTVAHRLGCCAACGISPDQVSNPGVLHWQADSLPLSHQGSSVFMEITYSGRFIKTVM